MKFALEIQIEAPNSRRADPPVTVPYVFTCGYQIMADLDVAKPPREVPNRKSVGEVKRADRWTIVHLLLLRSSTSLTPPHLSITHC